MRLNRSQEFLVGGYSVCGKNFDALIFGYYEADQLLYVGRTRSGFTRSSKGNCSNVFAGWRLRSARSRICRRRGADVGERASPRTR
jgi:hypothetical protein